MKKICILVFTLMSSILGFSQLLEVKGIETKLDVYDGSEYKFTVSGYDRSSTKWFGYSFYNMNGFHVSVEAELYMIYYREKDSGGYSYDFLCVMDAILIDTKTFNLAPEETYIWKQEYNSDFKKTDKKYPHGNSNIRGEAINYYVKYKAYKME